MNGEFSPRRRPNACNGRRHTIVVLDWDAIRVTDSIFPHCQDLFAMTSEAPQASGTKRILLCDDDYEIVESMRMLLESKGYAVLVARDGNQGLVMAERENPDLLILDMMMPKRSGFLVLEKLRRSRSEPMRIIMITA